MLIIRKANVNDASEIFEVIKKCADDMYEKKTLNHWIPYYSIENIKNDINEKNVFVLEENDTIIGTFTLTNSSNKLWVEQENIEAIYLSKLAVKPEEAGKGYGKFCMKFIEDYAKSNQYYTIRFDVYERSEDTIQFYIKRGYKQVGSANTRRFKVLLMQKILERVR